MTGSRRREQQSVTIDADDCTTARLPNLQRLARYIGIDPNDYPDKVRLARIVARKMKRDRCELPSS